MSRLSSACQRQVACPTLCCASHLFLPPVLLRHRIWLNLFLKFISDGDCPGGDQVGHGTVALGTFQCDSRASNGWWLCAPCSPQCFSLADSCLVSESCLQSLQRWLSQRLIFHGGPYLCSAHCSCGCKFFPPHSWEWFVEVLAAGRLCCLGGHLPSLSSF